MSELRAILKEQRPRLMAFQNVVGVGVGSKEVRGRRTEREAILVLVSRKLPEQELPAAHLVPRDVEGVETDVIEVGEIRLLRTQRYRPAVPGVSLGHYRVTAGTFGAVVRDRGSGRVLILSNNHVLANMTDGTDGRASQGDPVLQPAPADGGTIDDAIGRLERFVPLRREPGYRGRVRYLVEHVREFFWRHVLGRASGAGGTVPENLVDAALARPLSEGLVSHGILGIGQVRGVGEPEVGMKVQKSGRTTGVTTGEVRAVDLTLRVRLRRNERAVFTDQVLLDAMSQPGDSGSLVLDMGGKAVGLLFAGSSQATIMNRLMNVLDLLSVTV